MESRSILKLMAFHLKTELLSPKVFKGNMVELGHLATISSTLVLITCKAMVSQCSR